MANNKLINIYDPNLKKVAVLGKAYDRIEEKKLNRISSFTFKLPMNDPKNDFCEPFNYMRLGNDGDLYVILPQTMSTESGDYEYRCDHAISLLLWDAVIGPHRIGNLGTYTKDIIEFILSKQPIKRWILDECDFNRQFEYIFEKENALSSLFSLALPFTEQHRWVFNTNSYPFRLSLKKLDVDDVPELIIREKKNLLKLVKTSDPRTIATRIYPYGSGEGIYQTNITSVNNGVDYVESSSDIINKYGVKSKVWSDRRYEHPETLKSAALTMLEVLQHPNNEYEVEFAKVSDAELDTADLGKRVEIIRRGKKEHTIITELKIDHDNFEASTIRIANDPRDIANEIANLREQQRIETNYSQGASQVFGYTTGLDADKQNSAPLDFTIPNLRELSKVTLIVRVEPFRSFTKGNMSNGGQTIQLNTQTLQTSISTQTQGSSVTASSQSTTVDISSQHVSGNVSSKNVSINVNNESSTFAVWKPGTVSTLKPILTEGFSGLPYHYHDIEVHYHRLSFDFTVPGQTMPLTIPGQRSSINIPGQTMYFNIPSQTIYFTIPSLRGTTDLPSHNHDQIPGIQRIGNPTGFSYYVNDTLRGSVSDRRGTIDITKFFFDSKGDMLRGTNSVSISPNDLAFVHITLTIEGFIQSRGD